jgi:hypothetical protein
MAAKRRSEREPGGRFGSDAIPMRPPSERTAADEQEERLRLIVGPARRIRRRALGIGVVLLVVVALVLVLGPLH